jgi:6-phosphogluconolactonase (cycloisomerase 2 family)
VTVDQRGRFAYVTNAIAGKVSVYAIDATTGMLTFVSSATAGTIPSALTLDESGRFAYVASFGSDDVTLFAVDASSGALTPVGSPVKAGTGPVWVVLTK